jgi:hypothetical protein
MACVNTRHRTAIAVANPEAQRALPLVGTAGAFGQNMAARTPKSPLPVWGEG